MKKTKMTAGFTLVELIVVIAILGILAGVGTVGYSGYIKKANEAADKTLLASATTAINVAAIENRIDVKDLAGTVIGLTDGKIADVDAPLNIQNTTAYANAEGGSTYSLSRTLTGGAKLQAELNDAFTEGFSCEGVEFKAYATIYFNGTSFEGSATDTTYTFAGSTITLNAKDVMALSTNNAFTGMGSQFLLNEVGNLENLVELGAGDEILNAVKYTDDFLWALGSYAGMTMGPEEDDNAYLDRVAAYMMSNEDAVYSAQVMYAASNAASATDAQISKLFTYNASQGVTGRIQGTTDAETMANAALAYGMYVAYADKNDIDTSNIANFSLTLGTKEFCDYVASTEGQTDLAAYQAAMNMIGDNTGNSAVTGSILENGIANNEDLYELMAQIMGK